MISPTYDAVYAKRVLADVFRCKSLLAGATLSLRNSYMADSTSTTKKQALDLVRKANARARGIAKSAADQADRITGFAIAVGSGAGMGYYMAKSTDTDGKWIGVDKEIWIAGIAAALSFWLGSKKDRASQMSSNLLLNVATGVGASYAYGVAFQKTAGTNPDFS